MQKFTRKIEGFKELSYWERLEKLHLQSLQRHRERYSIILMWKMANDEAPNNISIRFYSSNRLGIRAEVPTSPTSTQSSIITKQYNSFAGLATRLWNTLPKKWILLEDWKISRFFWGSDWSVFLTGHLCRGTADKITIQFWNGPGGLFVRGMFDWADTIYVDIWRLLQSYKVTNILCW